MKDAATPSLEESTRHEIAGTCTHFHARRATRILAEVFDDALRPHGLKGTQFTLLVTVSLLGDATVGQLAEAIDADRTTLTRTLASIVEGLGAADWRPLMAGLAAVRRLEGP